MSVELLSLTPVDMFPYSSHVSMPYTEAQWIPNTMSYVPGSEYDSSAYTASAPAGPQRRQSAMESSSVSQQMLEMDRSRSGPSGYSNEDEIAQYQHGDQSRLPRYHDPNMSSYPYSAASNLPLSPPTSSTPYLGPEVGQGQLAGSTSPTPRADPVPIAPNPSGLSHLQQYGRSREEEELGSYSDARKRKRTGSTPERPPELTDEEKLLLRLKEDENLPWKDIAMRFQQELGKTYQVPALQMRFKRLRERIRQWTDGDIQALEQAFEYWEKQQFEIIATKMLDYGCSERFPAKAVQRKWEELHADKLAAPQQSFSFGHPNSTATYANATYATNGLFATQQHNFFRNIPIGPGTTPGISPFPSPNPDNGQFIFGQQPTPAAASLLSPAPVSLSGSAAASVYGTSPLLSHGGPISGATISAGGINGSAKYAPVPGSYIRSSSIPTPRSAASSPGPFAAPDDATMAVSGTSSVNDVGGISMGLGLGVSLSPSPLQQQGQPQTEYNATGRQRSFSSMH